MEKVKNFVLIITAVGLLLFVSLLSFISYNYANYLWFDSQGQTAVWWTTWTTSLRFFMIGVGLALPGYLVCYWGAATFMRGRLPGGTYGKGARGLFALGALVLCLFLHGPMFASLWQDWVLFAFAPDFGQVDPIFGRDVSFYMFQLEWYRSVLAWAKTYVFFLLVFSAVLFVLPWQGTDFRRYPEWYREAFRHGLVQFGFLAGALALIYSFDAYFERYALLFGKESGVVAGASYTDVWARSPGYTVFFYAGIVISLFLIVSGFMRKILLPLGAIAVLLALRFLALGVYPVVLQTINVNPNEFTAEKEYIEHSLKFTRLAYGLERVVARRQEVGEGIDAGVLRRNATTVKNIRLWDYRAIRDTFKQLQEIRPYYEFHDVDIDRYNVNGEMRQVMISARELNLDELPTQAQNWVQTRLQYTHGYGLVAAPSNRVTEEGLPELWVKNFPPASEAGAPAVKRPGVYFGELTNEYVIVDTKMNEIDYPLEENFAETKYTGRGGLAMGSGLRRFLLAWQFSDTFRILVSSEIHEKSRILFNRNILDAARLLAPFLEFDPDPYLVIGTDGHLYWMLDAYTISDRFPYSQVFNTDYFKRMPETRQTNQYGGFYKSNYVRNSVKVVIDAYDGGVKFYRFDDADPVIRAWEGFFPGLIRPLTEMPAFLREHVRYPEAMFLLQASIFTDYHMKDSQAFYNREDRWQIAQEAYGDANSRQRVEPYYTVIKFPGEDREEYILMLPFVPNNKDNMIAWMAARCDWRPGSGPDGKTGNSYGELLVFDFPRTRQIYGPNQIESRIDKDAEISRDLTLWSSQGSSVIRGNLLVIPVEDRILYIEPLYLESGQSRFPELKRVIAADGRSVVMRESLSAALGALTSSRITLGEGVDANLKDEASDAGPDPGQLAREAREAIRRARTAAGQGKWEEFGRSMQELDDILGRMER